MSVAAPLCECFCCFIGGTLLLNAFGFNFTQVNNDLGLLFNADFDDGRYLM